MNYTIIRGTKNDLDKAEKAYITDVPWGASYTPVSYFQGIFIENEGFLFRLTALEKEPTATMTGFAPTVSLDSCLEIFLNFAPEKTDSYINFEMNPNGAYLIATGPDRFDRKRLECDTMAEICGKVEEDRWSVTLMIPLKMIEAVYGKIKLESGAVFRGNAFKCGGKAPIPHHLTWAPVQRTERDFHRPDCFGSFTLL